MFVILDTRRVNIILHTKQGQTEKWRLDDYYLLELQTLCIYVCCNNLLQLDWSYSRIHIWYPCSELPGGKWQRAMKRFSSWVTWKHVDFIWLLKQWGRKKLYEQVRRNQQVENYRQQRSRMSLLILITLLIRKRQVISSLPHNTHVTYTTNTCCVSAISTDSWGPEKDNQ